METTVQCQENTQHGLFCLLPEWFLSFADAYVGFLIPAHPPFSPLVRWPSQYTVCRYSRGSGRLRGATESALYRPARGGVVTRLYYEPRLDTPAWSCVLLVRCVTYTVLFLGVDTVYVTDVLLAVWFFLVYDMPLIFVMLMLVTIC